MQLFSTQKDIPDRRFQGIFISSSTLCGRNFLTVRGEYHSHIFWVSPLRSSVLIKLFTAATVQGAHSFHNLCDKISGKLQKIFFFCSSSTLLCWFFTSFLLWQHQPHVWRTRGCKKTDKVKVNICNKLSISVIQRDGFLKND